MARAKRDKTALIEKEDSEGAQLERLTNLLALLVVKGETQPEKIKILLGAGFSNVEIAKLLGIKSNAVNVAVHRIRKKS